MGLIIYRWKSFCRWNW